MTFEVLDIGSGAYPKGDVNIDALITQNERRQFVTETDTSGGMFIKGDAHYLPIKAKSFNKVICYHTLEHLLRPYDALKEMHRVLKSNGQITIDLPNAKLVKKEHPTHLYSWSPDSICNLLKLVGFQILLKYVVFQKDSINMEIIGVKP